MPTLPAYAQHLEVENRRLQAENEGLKLWLLILILLSSRV